MATETPTTDRETGIPWNSSVLYVVLSSTLVGVMGVSLISPVLPDLRVAFGVSDARTGLVITAYTLPGIFLTPVIGLVADRVGRRRVIVPLLFTFGVTGGAIAFVDSFAHVLALRFAQGIGAGALVMLSVTLIGDVFEGPRRNAVMGLNGSAIGTGAAMYPLIGGTLATVRWSAPFLFFGTAVLAGLLALVVLEEPETGRSTNATAYLARLRDVAVLPRAVAIFTAIFLTFFVFYGAVLTALPFLLRDEFGLAADRIGLVLAMVSVASATVSSQYERVSRWRRPPELLALGFVAYGASLLGVWLAPSPAAVGAALLGFGVGLGIVMPSIDTTAVTLVSGDLRAGMMGMRTSMLRLGQTLGPVAFTFVAETAFAATATGYRTLLLATGTVVVLAGLAGYRTIRARGGETW